MSDNTPVSDEAASLAKKARYHANFLEAHAGRNADHRAIAEDLRKIDAFLSGADAQKPEPVAWRWRTKSIAKWYYTSERPADSDHLHSVQPLYSVPLPTAAALEPLRAALADLSAIRRALYGGGVDLTYADKAVASAARSYDELRARIEQERQK